LPDAQSAKIESIARLDRGTARLIGETFEKGCIGRLAALECDGQVQVVEMARASVKDVNELHLKHVGDSSGFETELGALMEMARKLELPDSRA
jgi:hypothetical protein